MKNTQAVFFTQVDNALGQVGITDTAAELPVKNVDGYLPQWIAVNIFNSSPELLAIEKRVFDSISVAHKAFIGTETGTGGPA